MPNSQNHNLIVSNPASHPNPQNFDEPNKPNTERDSKEQVPVDEHDHGKSHSGL